MSSPRTPRKVMTSQFEFIKETSANISIRDNYNTRHTHHRHVLRAKENTYKDKCKKVLKRKLKKYKLRQDGKEDQDVIDVSNILVSTLFIRSPNKPNNCVELESEEVRPKNYLFKMVRKKQKIFKTAKTSKCPDIINNEIIQLSPAEEKKQTNAFKLLMESRNKSLGSNSPGKDKPHDEIEIQDLIEKKNIKAKRTLILQNMAERKGSLKKAQMEENNDKYIKKKMDKRAEKLKSMIMNKEPKTVKYETQKKNITATITSKAHKASNPLNIINAGGNGIALDKSIKALQLVNIFSETNDEKISPERRLIPKEDEEFLKKLSPSLRKKESMLSYFKKVDKDTVIDSSENDNVIFKVKLGLKQKKKRKNKLSLNRDVDVSCEFSENEIQNVEINIEEEPSEAIKLLQKDVNLNQNSDQIASENKNKNKRKRKHGAKSTPCDTLLTDNNLTPIDDVRPRRAVKKPVKYNDQVALSSSDEELLIFTPKKKRSCDKNKLNSVVDRNINNIKSSVEKPKLVIKSAMIKSESTCKRKEMKPNKDAKPVKLAPIFSKSQPDPAIEAKQKFLLSGVPEQLKKQILKRKERNCLSDSFPIVVHVQQLDMALSKTPKLILNKEICAEEIQFSKYEDVFSRILNLSSPHIRVLPLTKNNDNIHTTLQKLKETYPRFPVHRTFKLLRGKKKGEFKDSKTFSNLENSIEILNCSIDMQNDNPEQLTWSDKYKPLSGNEIIGNFENVKELKKWLITWTENEKKSKKTSDSDSSDYYQSEADSRDSVKSNNNLLILSGPVGCGKTSCVYAVAAELSMKVIEVNASSKRTGKIMLQDLQEATQSHKVNRGTGNSENLLKSQEIIELDTKDKLKKRGRPKKGIEQITTHKVTKEKPEVNNGPSASQESSRTAMSLILIDDADIVFDQDDGFCSAIMQLVQCSKRPVILITGSLSLPHLQRFLQSSKVLKMKPLLPNILGTWLDLMCLADSGTCWPGLGSKFLNFFKGDIRKTINCLQFYVVSQNQTSDVEGSQTDSQNSDIVKLNADDESSCMSWVDYVPLEDKNLNDAYDADSQSVWDTFVNEHVHLKYMKYPLKMFNVWWSLPKILNIESNLDSETPSVGVEKPNDNKQSLESIGNVLDSISACDYFSHIRPDKEANVTSHPWYDSECNSVSELESLDYYDKKYETNSELCYELIKASITTAQDNMRVDNRFDLDFPGMSTKRQRDRIVSRHNNLTSFLSPQASLDRRALALDYWSSCRTICRIEKSKTDCNSKRNNRFCHYLKSLSVLSNSDLFDSLANSLNPSK